MVNSTNPVVNNTLNVILIMVTTLAIIASSYLVGSTDLGIYVLGGVLGLAVVLSVINRPAIGVFIIVVFIYLNVSDILEVQFGVPDINKALVALVGASIFAAKTSVRREKLLFGIGGILAFIYSFTLVLSILFSDSPGIDLWLVTDIIKDLVILFIILQISDKEEAWKTTQWLLILSAGLLSLLTSYQFLSGNYSFEFWGLAKAPVHQIFEDYDNFRPTGPLDDPNFYAQILVMVLPLALYRVLTDPSQLRRLISGVMAALIGFAIIATYSRGAFIAMLIVLLLIALERKYNLYKIATAALIGFVLLSPVLPNGFTDRISTLTELGSVFGSADTITERSLRGRTSQLIVGGDMFWDYPILGVGYGNYPYYYQDYAASVGIDDRGEQREAHSVYIEAMAETGFIGSVALVAMVGIILYQLTRYQQLLPTIGREDLVPWLAAIQFGLIAYSITSILLHDDYVRYYRVTIALAAGALIMAETIYNNHKAKQKPNTKNKVNTNTDNYKTKHA